MDFIPAEHELGRRLAGRGRAEGFPDRELLDARIVRVLGRPELVAAWEAAGERRDDLETLLFALLTQSFSLSEFLIRHPDVLPVLLEETATGWTKRAHHHGAALEAMLAEASPARVPELLRIYRRREAARIALLDILGRADIESCAGQLSELAEAILAASTAHVRRQMEGRFGAPAADGAPAQFAVIGMGKLGGGELNFSSDVDLIFIYRGEGKTGGGGAGRTLPSEEFFQRCASELISLLSQVTDEGIVYRVDVRLRPDGHVGALVRSLDAVTLYYESFAAPWERQALLRARPVAGDEPLGRAFMDAVRPHAFRRYIDMVEVSDTLFTVQSLRRMAREQLPDPEALRLHLKQRPGGIRDIEFLVQLVQMLYGGQYPEVRVEGTLPALRRIHESGLLTATDYESLSGAYRLLRRVEHRLQMAEDRQVYSLPTGEREAETLAWRLGEPSFDALAERLDGACRAVDEMLSEVFGRYFVQDDVDLFLSEGSKSDENVLDRLRGLGFTDPGRALELCLQLARDPEQPYLAAKLHRLAARLLPRLLEYLQGEPDPDSGLLYFCRVATAAPNRSSLLTSLLQNPGSLRLVTTIAAESPFLAELLERFPSTLDLLLHPSWFSQEVTLPRLEEQFRAIAGAGAATDRQLSEAHAGFLVLFGARYLLGLDQPAVTMQRLSDLAQLTVQRVYAGVLARHRVDLLPESSGLALIGLGKLGGREMNFGSDLDLFFVYADDSPMLGERGMGGSEAVQRFCGEVVREFSRAGWSGPRYEVDARLRPFGSQSPLAASLSSAERYYHEQASTWERLALSRARPLAGDPGVAEAFLKIAGGFTFGHAMTPDELDEVEAMRARIEREKSHSTLKAGRGGILDVEFLAQAAQLVFGPSRPEVRSTQTHAVLMALRRAGLLSDCEYSELVSSFYFLRDVENSLRIVGNVSVEALPTEPGEREALARRVLRLHHARLGGEAPPAYEFMPRLLAHQERVRRNYRRILLRWRRELDPSREDAAPLNP